MSAGHGAPVRVVFPHQLFLEHLEAPEGTVLVLVEHDLLYRQYSFHAQKLVLHRASCVRFADRLRDAGRDVRVLESRAGRDSEAALADLLRDLAPDHVSAYDVVDDWLARSLRRSVDAAGATLGAAGAGDDDRHGERGWDTLESPNFLTPRHEILGWFAANKARMQDFYAWQRRRLQVLVDHGDPVGGQWSFDTENRKALPRDFEAPTVTWPSSPRHPAVTEAIAWVREEFPDAPGLAHVEEFAWPTSHEEADAVLEDFLGHRFAGFGPYEDAISTVHPFLHHSLLTPGLNIGLLSPAHVLERALEVGEDQRVPLASLEGFVRQIIGWREYMRAAYHLWGRRLRTSNALEHARPLGPGWWEARTGLDPVDHVVGQVLRRGYAHHIERLMVCGNAMTLLRTDPTAVYEWFMEMFVDAYDWVMVPNVYAMSQFAAGAALTTKPYVSGSAYLRRMSDHGTGEWSRDWDALYWAFVHDHRDVFESGFRTRMAARALDRLDDDVREGHLARARDLLG